MDQDENISTNGADVVDDYSVLLPHSSMHDFLQKASEDGKNGMFLIISIYSEMVECCIIWR